MTPQTQLKGTAMTVSATPPSSAEVRPFLELNVGGMHLKVQRVPGWLIALVTTIGGSGVTALWMQR
ncbi:hypothetical protein ACFTWD_01375 [Streptomyces sp. NPDC056943]|uniref:hypothetical protein n=1 Tax=Streptomyces sp. NPDC056943 TaxID=3345971 RepID=UPI00363834A9